MKLLNFHLAESTARTVRSPALFSYNKSIDFYPEKGVSMSIKGLDVSEFQGNVDWVQVKNAGYQFAMLRAGYGFRTPDQQFRRNASECNRIGLPAGAYWFCYALSPEDARQEADGCLEVIAPYRLEYPICYDIEHASVTYAEQNGVTITPALATQIVKAFCNRIEERGYFAMYYSNQNFLETYLPPEMTQRYALWFAVYQHRKRPGNRRKCRPGHRLCGLRFRHPQSRPEPPGQQTHAPAETHPAPRRLYHLRGPARRHLKRDRRTLRHDLPDPGLLKPNL